MRLVVIESPLSGDVERNIAYAKRAARDCLARGEAPIASHLLLAQAGVLDDTKPEDRELGMRAGWAWGARAEACAAYLDFGVSSGMQLGIERWQALGIPVEERWIGQEEPRDE